MPPCPDCARVDAFLASLYVAAFLCGVFFMMLLVAYGVIKKRDNETRHAFFPTLVVSAPTF